MFGTLTLTLASALKYTLQILVLPVMARLLGPAAFGLVALAMPFILLATMISDAGLGNALVRTPSSSRELESTIFWLSLAISLVLAVILALLAWPISRLMAKPELMPILLVLTAILPIGGSLSVANARISRDRRFFLFAGGEVIATLASAAAGIGAAVAGAGPWSLVIQQCCFWSLKAVWLLSVSGFRLTLDFRPALVLPHLSFGLNAVGGSLADFASKSFPTLMIGGLIGVTAAGHYALAYQIVRVPEFIISGPIYLSTFASIARWGDDHVGAASLALSGLRGVATLLAPLFCGLALVSGLLVQLALGAQWAATGPILACLAPAGFFLCIYSFMAAILMGIGRSEQSFRLIAMTGCLLVAGTLVGAPYGGTGVAVGFSLGAALASPAYLLVLSRRLEVPIRRLVGPFAAPLAASLVMALAVEALMRHVPPTRLLLELTAVVLCGAVVFCAALLAIRGRRVFDDLQPLLAKNREARGA